MRSCIVTFFGLSLGLSFQAFSSEAESLRITNGIQRQPPRLSAVIYQDGCTGTFVSPTTIITAAHCADHGFTYNGVTTSSFQSMPEFLGVAWGAEIDVRVLVFPKAVAPAWIPVVNEPAFQGLQVVLAGFGAFGMWPDVKKDYQFRFGTNIVSSFWNGLALQVDGTKDDKLNGVEGTQSNGGPGDSGGPLLWNGRMVGVASGVIGTSDQGQATVYANLSRPEVRNFLNAQINSRHADIRFGGNGSIPYNECMNLDTSRRDFTFVFDVPHSNISSMVGQGGAHLNIQRKVSGAAPNNNFANDNAMNGENYTFSAPAFGVHFTVQDNQPTPKSICFN